MRQPCVRWLDVKILRQTALAAYAARHQDQLHLVLHTLHHTGEPGHHEWRVQSPREENEWAKSSFIQPLCDLDGVNVVQLAGKLPMHLENRHWHGSGQ